MKRIKAACLEQTIHFQLKDGISAGLAKQQARQEYESYKAQIVAAASVSSAMAGGAEANAEKITQANTMTQPSRQIAA